MSDITAVIKPSTDLVVGEHGTPMPIYSGDEMSRAFRAYRQLQEALDRAMPEQIQRIGDRPFRRKGYWRAIRTAFGLSVECVSERRDVIGEDAGWLVTYRAIAPNGMHADGDGACYASEKSRGRMTATEHNVRSHAHTRGFNRAVANLVGFGEVSAEEVIAEHEQQPARSEPARKPAKRIAAAVLPTSSASGNTLAVGQLAPLTVVSVQERETDKGLRVYDVLFSDESKASTTSEALADQASECARENTLIATVLTETNKAGVRVLRGLELVKATTATAPAQASADAIPF